MTPVSKGAGRAFATRVSFVQENIIMSAFISLSQWRVSQGMLALACLLSSALLMERASADDKPVATAGKPATVSEAVKALDFMTLPTLKGAIEPINRTVGRISYNAPSDCKSAFEFHRHGLLKQKWTEQPGTTVTDEYASGMYTKEGFVASMSAIPVGEPGMVNVSIMLHGNVDLPKLPKPADLKPVYVGPQVAMYSTEVSVEKTTEACHKLLLAQGWLPYGKAGETQFYKQNAIRLTAYISATPAPMSKTSVSFSTEKLSADVPAPVENIQLQYSDSTKEVLFDTKESEDAIEKFYRETLTKGGWKATTDKPFQIDWKRGLIFRNAAKDMLELEMYEVEDEKVLRVIVKHQTAAEVAAIEKADADALAAKKNTSEPKLGKVQITIPAGAEMTEITEKTLEFTIATGKGKTAAAAIRKALSDAGWKESVITADDTVGVIEFKKGEQKISLDYVDPGFIPAEITIRGTGVELEQVAGKK